MKGGPHRRPRALRAFLLRPYVIGPAVAVLAVAIVLQVRSSGGSAAAGNERLVTVRSGSLRQSVTASGTVQPANDQQLNFTVPGKVTTVAVSAGQKVAKGAVLATIDSASLRSQVAQAQATVDSDQAKLSSDTTSGASSAQLAADSANVTAAQAQLASAQSSLAAATLSSPIDGTVATVNLAVGQQLGSSGGSATSLTGSATGSGRTSASAGASSATPSGGAAGASSGNTGNGGGSNGSANSGSASSSASGSSTTPEVEVVSTDSYVVNLSVDDTQIGRVTVGQKATATPSSSAATGPGGFGGGGGGGGGAAARAAAASQTGASAPQQGTAATTATTTAATGTVTSVGVVGSSSAGVASFPVVVTLDGNPAGFHAGATAQVSITYQEIADALQVPLAAVNRSGGQASVIVANGSARSRRTVGIGAVAGGQVQITSGLTAGEQVVVVTTGSNATTRTTTSGAGGAGGNGGAGGSGGGVRRSGGAGD